MPQNYNTADRGLPSELRLIIWQHVLDSSYFYEEIAFKSTRANRPQKRGNDQGFPAFLPQSSLNILHLDRATRNEAYGLMVKLLPGTMTLDLSHLRRQQDLTKFLDDLPSLAYDIVGEIIIDHTPTGSLADRRTCAAETEKHRLDDLINKTLHLRCLMYVIDGRFSLDPSGMWLSPNPRPHTESPLFLDSVWSQINTTELKLKVAAGICQTARLYVRGEPDIPWRPLRHSEGNLQGTGPVKVERVSLSRGHGYERGPWELTKYDFLREAQNSPFAVLVFSKR